MADCRLLLRSRLLELAGERWTRRVVTLVAGPGFGKSVLLAQLSAENRLAPRGAELVVACTGSDGSPAAFLGRLAEALDQAVERAAAAGPAPIGPGALLCGAGPALAPRRLRRGRRRPPRHGDAGRRPAARPARHRSSSARALRAGVAPPRERPRRAARPRRGPRPRRARAGPVVRPNCTSSRPSTAPTRKRSPAAAAGRPSPVCPPPTASTAPATTCGKPSSSTSTSAIAGFSRWRQPSGPCDRELLRAAVGAGDDEETSSCSPSFRSSRARDGELIVHDLWRRAVHDALDRRRAARRRGTGGRRARRARRLRPGAAAVHVARAVARGGPRPAGVLPPRAPGGAPARA